MIKISYKILSGLHLKHSKIEGIAKKMVKLVLNLILPLVYVFPNQKACLDSKQEKIIISLTSFPGRIDKVWLCIETLLRQETKPDKLILWLSRDQFVKENKAVPRKLLRLVNRGLEVRFCDGDLQSHKKYYYALKEYPNSTIVTVDDDVFYPSDFISKLLDKHTKYPEDIISNKILPISFDDEGKILKYSNWKQSALNNPKIFNHFVQIGINGVLYPPNCLDTEVFNIENIQLCCPKADDLWLNGMAVLKGTNVREGTESEKSINYIDILGTKKYGLFNHNLNGGNDDQLKKLLEIYPEIKKRIEQKYKTGSYS